MCGFFIMLLFMVASCDAVCKDNQFACADGKQVLQNRNYICNHDNLMFPLMEQNNNNKNLILLVYSYS